MDSMTSPRPPAVRSPVAATARAIERPLMRCLEWLAAALVAADIAILLIGVIARYAFRSPLIWTDDLAQAVFLWLGMIGATVALNRGEHMRMTALIVRAPPGPRQGLEAFAAAFADHAEGALAEEDLRATTEIDAILPPGTPLTLDLCAELERLAPFGLGNAGVTLLAAGVQVAEAAQLSEGKHLRFRVRENGRDAGTAIAFGLGGQLDRFQREQRYDVAFRPQENHWNGTVSPQLVVKRIFDADERYEERRVWLVEQFRLESAERDPDAEVVFAELELDVGVRRHLLESASFRALLASASVLAEAA